jgi:hypothetical protein
MLDLSAGVAMWKHNFLFRAQDDRPMKESEAELFHEDTAPAVDSEGMKLEKFLSVWVQGEGDERPTNYTNVYVRTATLDVQTRAGFLQPLQGRTHQIKQMLTAGQKTYLRTWLSQQAPEAWTIADDQFKELFDLE